MYRSILCGGGCISEGSPTTLKVYLFIEKISMKCELRIYIDGKESFNEKFGNVS